MENYAYIVSMEVGHSSMPEGWAKYVIRLTGRSFPLADITITCREDALEKELSRIIPKHPLRDRYGNERQELKGE